MAYSKLIAEEDFVSPLYKNRRNLTIEVLDYICMAVRMYEANCSKKAF